MSSVAQQATTRHMAAVQQSEFDVQRFPVCVFPFSFFPVFCVSSLLHYPIKVKDDIIEKKNIKMVSTNSKLIS